MTGKAIKNMDEEGRRRQQEGIDRFRNSIRYQPRLIAFLDILGWHSAIDRSIRDAELVKQLGVALDTLSRHASVTESLESKRSSEGLPLDRLDSQATQFSDTIVLSMAADAYDGEAQLAMIASLTVITNELWAAGLTLRGAVVCGQLVHRAKVVFGPALIHAYKLEQDNPWPRIILDEDLGRAWGTGIAVLKETDKTLDFVWQHWRKDTDGKVFLDFLKPRLFFASLPPDAVADHLNRHRDLIVTSLKSTKSIQRDYEKYLWLARYFDCIIDEYDCKLDKINECV